MSRCTACNTVLTKSELSQTHPLTYEPEDMCKSCRSYIVDSWSEDDKILPLENNDIDRYEIPFIDFNENVE